MSATGVFETMGVVDGDLPLWELHMARLVGAVAELGGAWSPPPGLRAELLRTAAAAGHDVVRLAVRVGDGATSIAASTRRRDGDAEPLLLVEDDRPRPPAPQATLKLEARAPLDEARARARVLGAHDALLWRDGEVLECSAYNVFALVEGQWVTPPLAAGILPGIARRILLAGHPVQERPLARSELRAATAIVVTNAVYGPREAFLLGQATRAAGLGEPLKSIWTGRLRLGRPPGR